VISFLYIACAVRIHTDRTAQGGELAGLRSQVGSVYGAC
jgi:hypothetical protein